MGYNDVNFDEQPDVLTFIVTVQSQKPVYGVKALFELTYTYAVSVGLAVASSRQQRDA